MTQRTDEPMNERGLTKEKYSGKKRRINKSLWRGVTLGVAITIGNMVYQIIHNLRTRPEFPESSQVYLDTQKTLETLEDRRERELIKVSDHPYKKEELENLLIDGATREKISRLDDGIALMREGIEGMDKEKQTYENYQSQFEANYNRWTNYSLWGTGIGLGLVLTSGAISFYRGRKLGSQNFISGEKEK